MIMVAVVAGLQVPGYVDYVDVSDNNSNQGELHLRHNGTSY